MEIGRATGLSQEQVLETFEMEPCGRPLSLDAEYHLDSSEDTSTILDYVGEHDPDLETLADKMDLRYALQRVNPREQAVIYLRFRSGLSQAAVAQRFGMSQMHVSRLQRNAVSKLRQILVGEAAAA